MFKWRKNKKGSLKAKTPVVHRTTDSNRYFRFPLIPDAINEQRKIPIELAPNEQNKYQKEYTSLLLEGDTKQEKTYPLFNEQDTFFQEPKRKPTTTKPAVKKIFRPTQIPSSVYGFHERPILEKTVVHEEEKSNFMERGLTADVTEELLETGIEEVVEPIGDVSVEGMGSHLQQIEVEEMTGYLHQNQPTVEGTASRLQPQQAEVGKTVSQLQPQQAEVGEMENHPQQIEVENTASQLHRNQPTVEETASQLHRNQSTVEETASQLHRNQPIVEELASNLHQTQPTVEETENQSHQTQATTEETTTNPQPKKLNYTSDQILQAVPEAMKQIQPKQVPYNVMMLKEDKDHLASKELTNYRFPSLSLLKQANPMLENDDQWIDQQARLLQETLANFNVGAKVIDVTQGPSVTRFELQLAPGVKVNKITNLADDIKLGLAAKDIRIEAPIPGKSAVGIEVPNRTSRPVLLKEILNTHEFQQHRSPLTVALGLDIAGKPILTDVQKMPHGLIAGATGSGKSVCINSILLSILYKATPQEVKLILIDPKMVELAPYNNIPHLVAPVITDVKAATAALKWAVGEMEERYEKFAHAGARDLTRYNQLVEKHKQGEKLPYLVIVIDELADLMMVAPNDVEEAICRIAQKARACGIHLLLATQRPSVDVITGLIKANIPTRLAFSVSSQIDSRTIIDMNGADKLLGRGDMLFLENGSSKPIRAQGVFVSDDEIEEVVAHVKKQQKPVFLFNQDELVVKQESHDTDDELFEEACRFVVEKNNASASSLQRNFRIGYNRAARLIDTLEDYGIISEAKSGKPRDILLSSVEDLFPKR